MVPGWFDFVFVTVILVIGFEFGRMPLLPVLLSLIGKQAKNLVCVSVFPSDCTSFISWLLFTRVAQIFMVNNFKKS